MTRLRSCGSSKSALFWGDFPGQIGFNKDLKPFLKSTLTMIYNDHTLHNKYSFSLRIASINMTKSAIFCGLIPIILPKSYWFKNHTKLLILLFVFFGVLARMQNWKVYARSQFFAICRMSLNKCFNIS